MADGNRNQLKNYWKFGRGALKIRWNTPNDWTRCHRQLRRKVGSERAKRMCSQWHKEMTGVWPGSRFNV